MGIERAFRTLGNADLLNLRKVAFLCSRNCPAGVVDRAREWASEQVERGVCVISGFHSGIEKEVLQQLLEGSQPVILVLARGMMKKWQPEIAAALGGNRLLVITRYADSVTHASEESCFQRNRLMLDLADEVVIGYVAPGGHLERLCSELTAKKILTFHLCGAACNSGSQP